MERFFKINERIALPVSALSESGISAGKHRLSVQKCRNLRPVYGPDGHEGLEAVGVPAEVCRQLYTPVASMTAPGGGRALILLREPMLLCLMPGASEAVELGQLYGKFTCAAECGDRLLISDSSGRAIVRWSDGRAVYERCPDAEAYHGITLRAVHHTIVSSTVAERRLQRDYLPGELGIGGNDAKGICSDISAAYDRLCASARGMACFIQPLLARYKVYDSGKRLLYSSAPLLLSHPEGAQCVDAVQLRSSDRRNVESYAIQAKCWRMVIGIPDDLPDDASTVEITVTPQFHSCDGSTHGTVTLERNSSGGIFARATLPGGEGAISGADSGGSEAMLRQTLGRIDKVEIPLAGYSLHSGAGQHLVEAGSPLPCGSERRRLSAVLADSADMCDKQLQMLQTPNSFTAAKCGAGPAAVLWADPKVRRYCGCPLTQFAVTSASSVGWNAWIKVLFANGRESVVWSGGGRGGAPLDLNPLLSYPSSDAVRMLIGIKIEGRAACEGVFDLTADPSMSRAVYIHPTLLPFALQPTDDGNTAVPYPSDTVHEMPGVLAVAPVKMPFSLQSYVNPGRGRTNALAVSGGSQNAWDFGRARFYVFCEGGIMAVSSNDKLSRMAVSMVDNRVCTGQNAVAMAEGSIWAVASGDLIRINGNRTTTQYGGCGYKALAWSAGRRELFGFCSDGTVELTSFAHSMQRFELSPRLGSGEVFAPDGHNVLYACGKGIYNLADERDSVSVDVELLMNFSNAAREYTHPCGLKVDMSAKRFNGTLSLTRRNGSSVAPAADFGLIIRGEVRSAIGGAIFCRPASGWQLRMAGNASDLKLNGIMVYYE